MELLRQKNAATIIQFPLIDDTGILVIGATGLDSEIDTWSDGAAPDGFTDCTNEATEIGSTGQYYLSLTSGEMNADYIVIQVKSTEGLTQTIQINTKFAPSVDASGQVTVGAIANNAITANAINSDAITNAKIADNAIDADVLATGTITNAKFAAGAIDAAAIADGAIDANTLASGAITADALAADAVDEIWDDAPASELSSIPTATSSMREMIQWLLAYFKNRKTITETVETLYREDGSTALGTSSISDDDITFDKEEMS